MAVETKEKPVETGATAIPPYVEQRIQRGRDRMRKYAAQRRMFYKFWRGDTYWYVNSKGLLASQSTLSWNAGGQMPSHRIRNKYPFIASIVEAKVSAATQKVPAYEVVPSSTDPEDQQAADLAARVALFGYDEWKIRRATTKAVQHAMVGGEGFAYPYFDSSIGPFTKDGTDDKEGYVGQGDVRILILSANEVYWEPGADFEDARWCVIERAMPEDVVKEMDGYMDGELAPDATDADSPEDTPAELVLVREYLERPSAKKPQGRRIVMANKRLIVPIGQYPCVNQKGEVLDEPLLLRISYTVETDDRDRGLVERLVDLQRTIQDTWNKILEWKNRCLNPQMTAPRGSNMARRDDAPGATWYYTPVGGQKPEWETPPPVPRELFQILDTAIDQVRTLAADTDVQADPNVAAKTAQLDIEQNAQRWQSFLGDLAEFHSRLMRRCLYLVQRHYTEPRLVKVMGTFGPDLTPGFLGADLLGQADVRVSAGSLEARSRQQVIEETLLYADRGWVSPQAAMAAIQGGIGEKLGQGWKLDVAKVNQVIQAIKQGMEALNALPRQKPPPGFEIDPALAQDGKVPGWMPRQFDNVDIWREMFEAWMKTTDYDRLDDPTRETAEQIYDAVLQIQAQRQAQAAMAQQAMAEGQGMENAAKDQQSAPSSPDQRKPSDNQGLPTPNQPKQ